MLRFYTLTFSARGQKTSRAGWPTKEARNQRAQLRRSSEGWTPVSVSPSVLRIHRKYGRTPWYFMKTSIPPPQCKVCTRGIMSHRVSLLSEKHPNILFHEEGLRLSPCVQWSPLCDSFRSCMKCSGLWSTDKRWQEEKLKIPLYSAFTGRLY